MTAKGRERRALKIFLESHCVPSLSSSQVLFFLLAQLQFSFLALFWSCYKVIFKLK